MERQAYPRAVSDDEGALVAPSLTLMTEDAPQRAHSLREVRRSVPEGWLGKEINLTLIFAHSDANMVHG